MAILSFKKYTMQSAENDAGDTAPHPSHLVDNLEPKSTPRPALSSRFSSRRRSFQSQKYIKRQIYQERLDDWASNHDSSPYFHGKLSLLPYGSSIQQDYELGKSVHAILTDSSFPDARMSIVIRLFTAQTATQDRRSRRMSSNRRDSMEPLDQDSNVSKSNKEIFLSGDIIQDPTNSEPAVAYTIGNYKLLIRSGAGWIPAREYLTKWYFSQQAARRSAMLASYSLDELMQRRSEALGPVPSDKDSISIRPLFRPFLRLPLELQELILRTATGLTHTYNLYSDEYGSLKIARPERRAPISLATLFGVSKAMNRYLVPHIYHSTDFQFGLTGFTNFLWQSGPKNRPEVRRLTFHFGKMALLHCIRWLAPDPIFLLFEPPVATNPRSLQYFWRCQIQDLVKDLHLLTLTIDIASIPAAELGMVVAIMKSAFGSVERLRFVETDREGNTIMLDRGDEKLRHVERGKSWRVMCREYYARHRKYSYFFKFELLRGEMGLIEEVMDKEGGFFDGCVV